MKYSLLWGSLLSARSLKGSELVLPHHALNRAIGLVAVLGIFLFVVGHLNRTLHRKIDQLSDRHALVYFDRLLYGDLQRPVATKAHITFASRCMNIDPQPTR